MSSTAPRSTARPPAVGTGGGGRALALLCAAQFMVLLDASIVNVALPSIRGDLGFSPADLQWVVNAYTLAYASLLLLGGRLADIFGRRRLFLAGITVFTLASLAGGVAMNEGWLLAARAFQGVGGALLSPAILTILATSHPAPAQRTRAMGAWTAASGAGFAAGALIGGALIAVGDWRWTFFVNVPLGVAGFAAGRLILPADEPAARRTRADIPGVLLSTGGLLALTYGAVNSGSHGWSAPATWGPLAGGVLLLAWFAAHESLVAAEPIMPLRLLRSRPIAAANLTMVWLSAAVYPSLFLLSLYLQNVLGYSALKTGLAFLAPTLAMAAASQYAARLTLRVGARVLLLVAAVLTIAGLAWLSRADAGTSFAVGVLVPSTLTFLGLGFANAPLAMSAVTGVARQDAGLASGIVNTTRQVGITLGLAVVAAVGEDRTAHSHALDPLRRLTAGYGAGFGVAAGFAVVALLCACFLPGAPRE